MKITKFRAWDNTKTRPRMISFEECIKHIHDSYLCKLNPFEDKYITWMHYIGLNDITGKEIYKGDIVEFTDNYTDNYLETPKLERGVVDFNDGSFYIKSDFANHYRWIDYTVKVIGNIYENPNLLN